MSVDGTENPRQTRPARSCEECGRSYLEEETFEESPEYFPPPYDYGSGVARYCLACWLGVGPGDTARDDDDSDEIGLRVATMGSTPLDRLLAELDPLAAGIVLARREFAVAGDTVTALHQDSKVLRSTLADLAAYIESGDWQEQVDVRAELLDTIAEGGLAQLRGQDPEVEAAFASEAPENFIYFRAGLLADIAREGIGRLERESSLVARLLDEAPGTRERLLALLPAGLEQAVLDGFELLTGEGGPRTF
jgi:hypothetical protein